MSDTNVLELILAKLTGMEERIARLEVPPVQQPLPTDTDSELELKTTGRVSGGGLDSSMVAEATEYSKEIAGFIQSQKDLSTSMHRNVSVIMTNDVPSHLVIDKLLAIHIARRWYDIKSNMANQLVARSFNIIHHVDPRLHVMWTRSYNKLNDTVLSIADFAKQPFDKMLDALFHAAQDIQNEDTFMAELAKLDMFFDVRTMGPSFYWTPQSGITLFEKYYEVFNTVVLIGRLKISNFNQVIGSNNIVKAFANGYSTYPNPIASFKPAKNIAMFAKYKDEDALAELSADINEFLQQQFAIRHTVKHWTTLSGYIHFERPSQTNKLPPGDKQVKRIAEKVPAITAAVEPPDFDIDSSLPCFDVFSGKTCRATAKGKKCRFSHDIRNPQMLAAFRQHSQKFKR